MEILICWGLLTGLIDFPFVLAYRISSKDAFGYVKKSGKERRPLCLSFEFSEDSASSENLKKPICICRSVSIPLGLSEQYICFRSATVHSV